MPNYDSFDFSGGRTSGGRAQRGEASLTGDLFMAIPRGVEGAVKSSYGLIDTLTFDSLPDWEQRLLGKSKTAPGQFVEGAAEFAAGFIPAVGWVGRAGKVGRALGTAYEIEQGLKVAGKATAASLKVAAKRGAVAGAVADFTVFDGHEERLSNLVQSFPSLENPVTEFLAADPDDSEVVGRFKGVLEGLGLGVVAEGVMLGVRAMKAGRAARAAGAGPEEIEAAMDAVAPPDEIDAALGQQGVIVQLESERPFIDTNTHGNRDRLIREYRVATETFDGRLEVEIDGTHASVEMLVAGDLNTPAKLGLRELLQVKRQLLSDNPGIKSVSWRREGTTGGDFGRTVFMEVKPPRAPDEFSGVLKALGADPKRIEELQAARQHRADLEDGLPRDMQSLGSPRKLRADERLELELVKTDLNLSRYRGPDGALHLLRAFEDLFDGTWRAEEPNLARRSLDEQEVETFQAVADLAHANNAQSLMVAVQRGLKRDNLLLPKLNARARAYKTLMLSFASEIERTLPKAGEAITDQARIKFAQDIETLADITSGVKGLLAEQGRGLGANRINTQSLDGFLSSITDPKAAENIVRGMGGKEAVDELMAKFRAAQAEGGMAGAVAATKLAQATTASKFVNWTTTYWMNAILSGPLTWAVNGTSGAFMAMYRPFESMLGASVQYGIYKAKGDAPAAAAHAEIVQDTIRELMEIAHAVPEAFRAAKAVLRTGENILDPAHRIADSTKRNVIAAKNSPVDLTNRPMMASAVDWIGRQVDIPSRILAAQDEFTKQVVYRSSARAQLAREGLKAGIAPDKLGEYVVKRMDDLITKGQAYSSATAYNRGLELAQQRGITNAEAAKEFAQAWAAAPGNFDKSLNALSEKALAAAEDVTFTRALGKDTRSAKIQAFVIAHPEARFVVPFVRTPLNILGFTAQRFDAVGAAKALVAMRFPAYAKTLEGSKSRIVQDLLSGDQRRVSDAVGRFAAGAGFAAFGISLASQGIITGRGPSDPEQRKLLEQSGWLPYAIKTPTGYISYARVEPFATIIGTLADVFDYNRYAPKEDQDQLETYAIGVGVALANNFTNKTYLTGIGNFVEAVQAPDRKMDKFFQKYAASFVPNFAGQLTRVGDDDMREVRTMLDAMLNKVPGMSETLAPARNLLGEKITRTQSLGADSIGSVMNILMPVAYREVSDSVVSKELADLRFGFSPPKSTVNGIDLTTFKKGNQDAFDRWAELHGTVKVSGRTLGAALKKLIQSEPYQRLPIESTNDLDSPRVQLVSNMVRDYRRAAYAQMLREYPEVNAADRAFVRRKKLLKQGRDTRFLGQ